MRKKAWRVAFFIIRHQIKEQEYATISEYYHGFYKRPSSDGEGLQVA